MKNPIDKLKNYTIEFLLATVFFGWLAVGASTIKYESGREVFQGYNISDDGRIEYVFDPKDAKERGFTAPKYRIYGHPSLTDSLKMGELYCFTTKKRSLPWSKKYIGSITPYDPKNSKKK